MQEQSRRPLLSPTPRGVHHLALCTDDMKATIDFYVEVLGMPLVHAMKVPPGLGTGPGNRGNPPYEQVRHYFFDMGNDSLLAFFSTLASTSFLYPITSVPKIYYEENLSSVANRVT